MNIFKLVNPPRAAKGASTTSAPVDSRYERDGVTVRVEFATGRSVESCDLELELALVKANAEAAVAAQGWSLDDKLSDLRDPAARHLLLRCGQRLVGFAHFRLTLQGEVADVMEGEPVLLLADLYLEEALRRKGLGKHCMTALELAARKAGLSGIMVAVPAQLADACAFFHQLRGFQQDVSWSAAAEGTTCYCKLSPQPGAAAAAAPPVAPTAPVKEKAPVISPDSVLCSRLPGEGPSPTPSPSPPVLGTDPGPIVRDLSGPQRLEAAFACAAGEAPPAVEEVPFWMRVAPAAAPAAPALLPEVAASAALLETSMEGEGLDEDASEEEEDELDNILSGLMAMFRDKHGREPTAEEIAIWTAQLREAAADGALAL